MRLTPVAARLSDILEQKVNLTESCIGEEALAKSNSLNNGDVLLLENVRFYEEEEKNDNKFAEHLASFGDIYVNDCFSLVLIVHMLQLLKFLNFYPHFLDYK